MLKLKLMNVYKDKHEQSPFHLLDPSPWPFCLSIALFGLVSATVAWMHGLQWKPVGCPCKHCYSYIWTILLFFISVCLVLYWWFSDIITESVFQGHHTLRVVQGLKLGIILFIVSEVMFFFSFFWAFFTYSLTPSIWIGCMWPPKGIFVVNALGFPLVNTWILLTSGCFITYAHASILAGNKAKAKGGLLLTLLFAVMFLVFQGLEYFSAKLFINDSVYGSIFYLITGFHGFHVFVGTIMIFIAYCRLLGKIITMHKRVHIGFLCAVWYWHFVDVVWLFVWFFIYCWGQL